MSHARVALLFALTEWNKNLKKLRKVTNDEKILAFHWKSNKQRS